jgi:hypothetical protein
MLGKILLAVVLVVAFCLPPGILLTAAVLEYGHFWLSSLGIGLLAGGMVALDFGWRTWGNATGVNEPQMEAAAFDLGPTVFEVLILQAITIIMFALILDGGVRLRACLYSYLAYAPGAVILLVRRGRAMTQVDLVYLKWGWVPIVTIGVPLLVRLSKGLI